MAGLLVSVRSADEARAALAGGATVIDVKEPDRGALGRADAAVWRDVVRAVACRRPVSVALGELRQWDPNATADAGTWERVSYRKVGLAAARAAWVADWMHLLSEEPAGPEWIAVVYADWELADAPSPEAILDVALHSACRGILVDTWDKSQPSPLDLSWASWVARARAGGLLVALAGGLDEAAIGRLAPLGPDLFAVRGAACSQGDRRATIDPARVARLVRAAAG